MDYSVAEAKAKLPQLIRALEGGEDVIITRNGKPIAQLAPPPLNRRPPVRLGMRKGKIKLLSGWDEPISENRFLEGGL